MELLSALDNNLKTFQNNIDLEILKETRMNAYKKLSKLGIPHRRTESYKYTNIKKSFERNIDFPLIEDSNLETSMLTQNGFINLFCVNGQFFGSLDGLTVTKLNKQSQEIISMNQAGLKNDFLYQLNESTINHGHHFHFHKNFKSDLPIMIHNILDTQTSGIYNFHNTFNIESNSKVEVIECYQTIKETSVITNYASNVVLDENAKFTHIHHQDINFESTFINNIRAQVPRNSHYENFTITLGGALTRNNIHIDLIGEGANCMAHGVYTLQKTQHSDVNSFINHKAPHTESSQLYKGIMSNKSRGVFTGLIKVDRDAQLINSNQLNKNLLLNKGAHANSCPQLEIFADDVKCAHGSTTGQLSEDELFYFESRGIRPEKARMMLSHAYTYDVLLKIENLAIRNYINHDIVEKFEKSAFEVNDD